MMWNYLKGYMPFLEWIPELKNPKVLRADIFAGITVAVVLIPQAMAYAQLAGLPPYIGLYTAFLPVIIGGIFSSSRQLSTGPVTVISLMTATALAPFALGAEEYIMYAAILAIMMGVMQLTLGFLKLGSIFNFLSHSVIVGFINAAAILIGLSQLKGIFGVDIESGLPIYETIPQLVKSIYHNTNTTIFIFGVGALMFLYILQKYFAKLPKFLILVVASIIISYMIGFENLGGSVVGNIPQGLPSFYMPTMNKDILLQLLPAALIVGFLGFTEAISIAKSIGLETKKSVSTDQMLISEGLANLVSGFSKGYPVSGTFARSAINLKAGAVTPFASVITGLIIGAVLLFFTEYLYHLPNAVLSAMIIMAVVGLIHIEPIIKSWKIQKTDAFISIITFIVTLAFAPHLEVGIFTGVFLSLIFHLHKSMKPRFSRLSLHPDGQYRDAELHGLPLSKNVGVFKFYGKLYFVNIWYFEGKLMKYIEANPKFKVVIIDFSMIPYIDSSAMEVLENLVISMQKHDLTIHFVGLRARFRGQMKSIGYIKEFGKKNIYPDIKTSIKQLSKKSSKLDLQTLVKKKKNK